jgi:putative Mg2+ transporter-C (MgtC) family protein
LHITHLEVALRLILSLVLAGLIGLERESLGRPAGFRTHILVGMGSALIMIVSIYAFPRLGFTNDPGRIAAQVVSGIGFLGAGTIMREGATIRGLTTAASLWTVAGIGLTVGAGLYFAAIVATVLVVTTLVLLNKLEWSYLMSKNEILTIIVQDTPGQLAKVFAVLAKHDVNVHNVQLTTEVEGEARVDIEIELAARTRRVQLIDELVGMPGVHRASYK